MERPSRLKTWLALSGLVALAAAGEATGLVRSDDAWLHLAAGREIVTRGALPDRDVFLHENDRDRGAPWLIHSWLAEVIAYGAMRAGGLPES